MNTDDVTNYWLDIDYFKHKVEEMCRIPSSMLVAKANPPSIQDILSDTLKKIQASDQFLWNIMGNSPLPPNVVVNHRIPETDAERYDRSMKGL